MCPRRYRSDRRKAATEETRRRIVDSTVSLHAEYGAIATTYAMIAEHADVAIPTVYNHFPTLGDLLTACTGQAAAHAPSIGPEIFAGLDDLDSRLRALLDALFAQYDYYAPWLRWTLHEAHVLPVLAAWLHQADDQRRQLITHALEPAFGTTPPAALLTLFESLTDFPTWQRFASDHDPLRQEAKNTLVEALALLARQHGADGTSAYAGSESHPTRETT